MVWEILHKATTVAMLSFVVSSMLAMGTGLTVGEIVAAVRNHRLIMVALLANFVLIDKCRNGAGLARRRPLIFRLSFGSRELTKAVRLDDHEPCARLGANGAVAFAGALTEVDISLEPDGAAMTASGVGFSSPLAS
jgi:hypothetical protein